MSRLRSELFRHVIESVADIVVITDANPHDPRIVFVNPAFTELTGFSAEEAIGKNPNFLQGSDTDPETRAAVKKALVEGRSVIAEILNYTKDGTSEYWLEMKIVPIRGASGAIEYFAATERDVTDRLYREKALEELSASDPLTGLLNRRAFEQILEKELARSKRTGAELCLALMDVDNLKGVNDTFGHQMGDLVLSRTAEAALHTVRRGDFVARIGGDEFAILLPGTSQARAKGILSRLKKVVSSMHVAAKEEAVSPSVSVGIAERSESESAAELLDRADAAMYLAKSKGSEAIGTLKK